MCSLWITVVLCAASTIYAAEVNQNSIAFLDPNYQFEQLNEQNVKLVLERRPVDEKFSPGTLIMTTTATTTLSDGHVNYDFATTSTLTKFITVEIAPRIDARLDELSAVRKHYYKPGPSDPVIVTTLTRKVVGSPFVVTSTDFISTSVKDTFPIISTIDATEIAKFSSAIEQRLSNETFNAIKFKDVRIEQMASISEVLRKIDANKSNTLFGNQNGTDTISSGVSKIELGIGIIGCFMVMMIMMT